MTDRAQWAARQANYLSKAVYPPGQGEPLTIRDVRDMAFSSTDGSVQHKLVLDWQEERPSLALNKTNLQWLIGTFGADDDNWVRKQVFVFHDPTVKYGSRIVGGLVLDLPKNRGPDPELRRSIANAQGDSAKARTQANEGPSDDIPF